MRARGREKEGRSRWEWRRERAVLSDAALFAKSTSSTLTPRQSSGEQVFSCTNPSSLQPASIFTMAAVAWSPLTPTIPRPPLRRSLSLYPLLCLHNATLAEDGKERTHSFRIPPDPTSGSCSWVYHSKQRGRNKPRQPHSSARTHTPVMR